MENGEMCYQLENAALNLTLNKVLETNGLTTELWTKNLRGPELTSWEHTALWVHVSWPISRKTEND